MPATPVRSPADLKQPSHPAITFLFHYCHLTLSPSALLSARLPLSFSNDALSLLLRSVDALTLISVINWRDLLHSLSLSLPVIPSGLHHSPSSRPLLPFLFSSSFHQMLAPLSHLHSLNQLLSTHPCDPILFHPTTTPPPFSLSLSSTSAAI